MDSLRHVLTFLISWFCYNIGYIKNVKGHSWVACTDYRGDVNYFEQENCKAWPRNWIDRGSAVEPVAGGYQIGVDAGRAFARGTCDQTMASPWQSSYTKIFPHAIYETGKVYCLAWTTQNHATVPDDCTNPYQKSDPALTDSLTLYAVYVADTAGASDPIQTEFYKNNINELAGIAHNCNPENNNSNILSDNCQLGLEKQSAPKDCKGFQRAPKFCENTGSALATGCFQVPSHFQPGHYVAQWNWNTTFTRPGRVDQIGYKTCFDFEVVDGFSSLVRAGKTGVKGTPESSLPCTNNMEKFSEYQNYSFPSNEATMQPTPLQSAQTSSPTQIPAQLSNGKGCSNLWHRCGGPDWNGSVTCCEGSYCSKTMYDNWPVCVLTKPTSPPTQIPSSSTDNISCSKLWERCGGENWEGPTCCAPGTYCDKTLYPNWFVCVQDV